MRTALLALALLLIGSTVQAQEPIVVAEGDTLIVKIVGSVIQDTLEPFQPPDLPAHQDTLDAFQPPDLPAFQDTLPPFQDTVTVEGPDRCPDGWTCIEPEPTATYVVSVSAVRNEITGELEVPAGDYYIHLDRVDGAWDGSGIVAIAGVDSVIFVLGGVRNRERLYPYEVTGDVTTLSAGEHLLTWEVFGDDPDSGSVTIIVTTGLAFRIPEPVPMDDGLMVQAEGLWPVSDYTATLAGVIGKVFPDTTDGCINRDCTPLGWYWLPAPPTGRITVIGPNQTWSQVYE